MSYLTPEIEKKAIDEAAKAILPKVMEWLEQDGADYNPHETEEFLSDLKKVFDTHNHDGYALAKELDDWSPNAELVDILDQVGHLISSAERKLIKLRLQEENIRPQLAKGSKVKIPGKYLRDAVNRKKMKFDGVYEGTINGIDEAGSYVVNCPEAGHIQPESKQTGTTGVYIIWHDLEAANSGLLQPS